MEQRFRNHFQNERNGLSGEEKARYVDSMVNEHIIMLSNRELADEDQFQCKFCTDLCYMSMITCKDHTLGGIDINLMHM